MTETPRSLTPTQLDAYLAFTEVGSLLRPAVEAQLRDAGGLSYVQFQLLARLGDTPDGHLRMTDLADGVVYSRSGLTYQAQLLEQRGLITRSAPLSPSPARAARCSRPSSPGTSRPCTGSCSRRCRTRTPATSRGSSGA
jgi:hypothetical protein